VLTNFIESSKQESSFKFISNEIVTLKQKLSAQKLDLIKANKKGFKIREVPIIVLYDGNTSTHHPVTHGVSVILSTMKFISIEHPLRFYGIPGIIFLGIGLFFIVWTIQAFTETHHIIINISLIGIGAIIIGTVYTMTSIMLYSLVNVVRERNSD